MDILFSPIILFDGFIFSLPDHLGDKERSPSPFLIARGHVLSFFPLQCRPSLSFPLRRQSIFTLFLLALRQVPPLFSLPPGSLTDTVETTIASS